MSSRQGFALRKTERIQCSESKNSGPSADNFLVAQEQKSGTSGQRRALLEHSLDLLYDISMANRCFVGSCNLIGVTV